VKLFFRFLAFFGVVVDEVEIIVLPLDATAKVEIYGRQR
jgi:hypothetical protein